MADQAALKITDAAMAASLGACQDSVLGKNGELLLEGAQQDVSRVYRAIYLVDD